jgi:hypothetical protein
MPDYSQGKIYKIISTDCDDVYYGSTTELLNVRLIKHRYDYNQYLKGEYYYVTSYKLLEKENYEIVLVEDYPCENEIELKLREAEYIKNNVCVNKCIPCRTKEEYYQDNREKLLEKAKNYYVDNREKVLEYHKKYNEINCEKISQKNKEYYKKTKEQRTTKIICEFCGFELQKINLKQHQKTKRCLDARSYDGTHNAGH